LRVAQRVLDAFREPIVVNEIEHVVSASIGVAYGRIDRNARGVSATANETLQDADTAMYRAKSLGKDRFEVFTPGMSVDQAERGRVEQVLRRALRAVDVSGAGSGSARVTAGRSSPPPTSRSSPRAQGHW
jgi:predicted signal transduction protein with EAL and GGDEF domain